MSELSAEKGTAELPTKDFGLPEKARTEAARKESGHYPMPDKKHARNAKSRAAQLEETPAISRRRSASGSTGKPIASSTTEQSSSARWHGPGRR